MKKVFRLLGIITLAVVFGFAMASCGDDDNDNNNGDGVTSTGIKYTNANVYLRQWCEELEELVFIGDMVTNNDYDADFIKFWGTWRIGHGELSNYFEDPVVSIEDGKLSINLGVPELMSLTDYILYDGWEEHYDSYPEWAEEKLELFSDPDAEVLFMRKFYVDYSPSTYDYTLTLTDGNLKFARFIYSDRPVVINGEDYWMEFDNVSLQTGWNVVFIELFLDEHGYVQLGIIRNGTLDSSFKWILTPDHSGHEIYN